MSHVFPSGTKQVYRLKLASGRVVRATANHPFLALDGWRSLGELNVGDRIATPRRLPQSSAVREWPTAKVVLLAHLIGDGCVAPRQPIHYTSADPDNLRAVEEAAAHFGVRPRRVPQRSWTHVYLPAPHRLTHGRRNPIAAWLGDLGLYGRRSFEKFIPAGVFALPDHQIALFLRHLWATDGSVTTRDRSVRIYYATTSQRLARDVQQLLLRLDLRSRVRTTRKGEHRPAFTVDITGVDDQRRFLEVVGVHGARAAACERARTQLRDVHANTNTDTLPIDVWRAVRHALRESPMTSRQFQAAVGMAYNGTAIYRHAPSRPKLMRIATALQDPSLARLATSDLFWDRVTSIEADGVEPVYDATVLGTHNFIADGIVVHNSIEQDADVVIFLYREGEQNAESEVELLKAKVAKHRNGPIGEVPLQFRKSNTRFYTMTKEVEVQAY
jgi:replicative DNA helicase